MSEKRLKDTDKQKQRAYLVSSSVNIILAPVKLAAGILGRSSSLIADSINSLGDVLANAVVYLFLKISAKPRDKNHAYGHGKFETLAALLIGLTMLIAAIMIVVQSVSTLGDFFESGTLPPEPKYVALIVALITLVTKAVAYWYTRIQGQETASEALAAQAEDHRMDIYSAFAVSASILCAKFFGGNALLTEPIATIIVAGFIAKTATDIIRSSIYPLTDASVPDEVVQEIKELVSQVPGIYDPHNFRTRMIGSDTMAIEMDIRTHGSTSLYDAHELTIEAERLIRDRFGDDTHISIHVEPLRGE